MLPRPVLDDSSSAQVHPFSRVYSSRDMDPRCERCVVIKDDILANGAVQIDLHMLPKDDVCCEAGSRRDDGPEANIKPSRTLDTGMHECGERESDVFCFLHEYLPYTRITDPAHDLGFGKAL